MRFWAALSERHSVETEGQQFHIITVQHPPYLMLFFSQSESSEMTYELPWSVLWKNYFKLFFFPIMCTFHLSNANTTSSQSTSALLEDTLGPSWQEQGPPRCLELSNRHTSLSSSSIYLSAISVRTFEFASFSFRRNFSWHVKCEQKRLCNKK